MKNTFKVGTAMILIGFIGCASDPIQRKQELGGLATTSTMLIALPLLPMAEAYHLVSGDIRKDKKRMEEFWENLDPIYEARIGILSTRDPHTDARMIASEGSAAFLYVDFNPSLYPGVHEDGFAPVSISAEFFEKNQNIILRNELLLWLQTLVSKDPVHQDAKGITYTSNAYREFLKVSSHYMREFNKAMLQYIEQGAGANG